MFGGGVTVGDEVTTTNNAYIFSVTHKTTSNEKNLKI